MASHRPRRTEVLRDVAGLLDAMGRCRKAVLNAQDSVKPFGVMFHGCGMVTAAIDALAFLVTGHPHYYSLGGSAPTNSAIIRGASSASGPGAETVNRDPAPKPTAPEDPGSTGD